LNRTTRTTAALASAICLSALSASAVNGKHARPHTPSKSKTSAAAKKPVASNNTPLPAAPVIDRATHGRDLFDSAATALVTERGENIARTALAFRGVPYRFGGRSARSGFDCSGLVQAVCGKWGIYLPRVAGAQFTRGKAVKPAELRPGDLVFFQGTYKRGLSHVGIFIGEGKFVHAAGQGKGVRISALADSYFQKHWAGARRFDLDQLPKVRDEMPVLASAVIVDRPAALPQPQGRFLGPDGRTPTSPTAVDAAVSPLRDLAPRSR